MTFNRSIIERVQQLNDNFEVESSGYSCLLFKAEETYLRLFDGTAVVGAGPACVVGALASTTTVYLLRVMHANMMAIAGMARSYKNDQGLGLQRRPRNHSTIFWIRRTAPLRPGVCPVHPCRKQPALPAASNLSPAQGHPSVCSARVPGTSNRWSCTKTRRSRSGH